jgi:hypothetical protein
VCRNKCSKKQYTADGNKTSYIKIFEKGNTSHKEPGYLSGTAPGYGMDDWGFEYTGWEFFSSSPCPYRLWGLPSLLFNGYLGDLSLGVKEPEREVDHSPPSTAEV